MEVAEPARVVVAGGGVAALEVALGLRAAAEDRVSVRLIAPDSAFSYRPLAVAEPFELGSATRFDLGELAEAAGATFALGALAGVDSNRHVARLASGEDVSYDFLVVACGTVPGPAVPGALTFRGSADVDAVGALLEELAAGEVRRVVFAVPAGAIWSLPAYELALLTAAHLEARGIGDVELALVTPEDEPLSLFGSAGSAAVRELLDAEGIAVHAGVYPAGVADGELRLLPEGSIPADRVVALPRLRGPRIDGLPQTVDGFVPVDAHGRVRGLDDVFAAGDITSFPIKQGGIAAQQAEVVAEAIAAAAGADLSPRPFRPVLRGLLLTGRQPQYLRRELAGGYGTRSAASPEPLWWPPAKIVGRYLAPFLASFAGVEVPPELPAPPPDAVPVDVELPEQRLEQLRADLRELAAVTADDGEATTVGRLMVRDPLVVAPEDTLGEIAEKMREHDAGSALVADFGRLVGILTSRDLLRAFAGRVHSSEARVREWMTVEPIAVTAATSADAAVTLMLEHGIHHLPVVEDERPVGMLGFREAARQARGLAGIGLGF